MWRSDHGEAQPTFSSLKYWSVGERVGATATCPKPSKKVTTFFLRALLQASPKSLVYAQSLDGNCFSWRLLLRVSSEAGRTHEMTLICSISVKRRPLPLSLRAAEMISLGVGWKGPMMVLYSEKRGSIPEANPTKGSSQYIP